MKFAEEWIERKMLEKVAEYKRKYPAFSYGDEYLEWVASLPQKVQRYQVYQPISKWDRKEARERRNAKIENFVRQNW